MGFVRQTYKSVEGWLRGASGTPGRPPPGRRTTAGRRSPASRRRLRVAVALLLSGLVGAACAEPAGRPAGPAGPSAAAENAAPGAAPGAPEAPVLGHLSGPARAIAEYAGRLERKEAARLVAARKWGLLRAPLVPPPPPAVKPELITPPGLRRGADTGGLPAVITRVPTDDPVVFLTIDDGDHKDPRLLRMLDELDVLVSAFLTDSIVRDGYDYFRSLRDQGNGIHNHALHHRYLPALPHERQRHEICGQQANLEREAGVRPRIFRPPFGGYDRATLRAAASCGIEVVPLWTQEAFPERMEYRRGAYDGTLRRGDIVLTHFRGRADWGEKGGMADVVRRVLREATEQGLAVARLEDYV